MPVTEQDAAAVADVAVGVRRDRALSRWDHAGVVANIRKIAHLELPDVAMAVIRAAADPDARTPGVIPKLDAPHWRERITDPDRPTRPSRDDWCRDCGGHRLNPTVHGELNEDRGIHPFVHVDTPVDGRAPDTLRQMVAAARPLCETPTDDQHTTEETP